MTAPLQRFLRPPQRAERCEICMTPIGDEHGHVIDLPQRRIQCACRGCYLLFTSPGAGGARFRAVPQRYRHQPEYPAGEQVWEQAGIPVRMAFFFHNTEQDRVTAFYPSPAGATESLLPLDNAVLADHDLGPVEPDVEALLVNRTEHGFEAFLVPIDACYRLVGIVKLRWRGFDGGAEAWAGIDAFFAELRERGHG